MFKNWPALVVAGVVIAIIFMMMCSFQVRFTETAVVTRFDRIIHVIDAEDAGLHAKWFWPIDEVHRYDTRLRAFETEFRQQGTKDQRTIILTVFATWRVKDAAKFLKAVGPREEAGVDKIRDRLESAVSSVLQTHVLGELVNTDPAQMKIGQIEDEILAAIQADVLERYGIQVSSVGIKRFGLPESVTKEVFARMKEDRQKTIKQLEGEGDAEADKITADSQEKASKILARARAYAQQIRTSGELEVAKYYKFFEENRELSDFLKKRDTLLRIINAGQITLVLDAADITPFEFLRRDNARSTGPRTAAEPLSPDLQPKANVAARLDDAPSSTDAPLAANRGGLETP